jgi:glycosyltransferase involved in cell wall biosynthesis
LFEAARIVGSSRPDVRFVLAGGRPEQIGQARVAASQLQLSERIIFAGQRPAEEIPQFLDAADLLVSPRSTGTNTPLKIYQYLRSGKPIVATRLLTHTQVLNDDVAMLTPPTAAGLADGILRTLADPERARLVGERAKRLAETKYSYEAYLDRTREAVACLRPERAAQVAGDVA